MEQELEKPIITLEVANVEDIVRAKMALADLRKEQRELDKALKDGSLTEDEYIKKRGENIKATAEQQENLRGLNHDLKTNIKTNKAAADSIDEMRAKVIKLTKEYTAMSKADRDSAAGQALKGQIKDINDNLKDLEGGYGDFRRNVGNYTNGVLDALGKISPQVDQAIQVVRGVLPVMQDIPKAATTAAKGFNTLRGAIMASGIGLLVLALISAITYLTQFDGALDDIEQALAGVRAAITPVIGWLGQMFKNIKALFGTAWEFIKAAAEGMKQLLTGNLDAASAAFSRAGDAMKKLNDQRKELIPSMRGLGDAMGEAYQKAAALTKQIQDLEDAELSLAFRRLKIEKQMAQLEKASEDRSRSSAARLGDLNKAREMAISLAKEQADLDTRSAMTLVKTALSQAGLNKLIKDSGTYTSDEIELIQKKIEAMADAGDLISQYPDIMAKLQEAQKKQLDSEQAVIDTTLKYNAMTGKLVKAERAAKEARIKEARELRKKLLEVNTEIAQDDEQKLLAKRRLLELQMRDELASATGSAELQKAIRVKYDMAYNQLDKEFWDKKFADRVAYDDKLKAIDEDQYMAELSELERYNRLQLLAIDQAQANQDITKADAEQRRLDQQAAYLQKLLDLQTKFGKETTETESKIAQDKIAIATKEQTQREAIAKAQIDTARNVVNSMASLSSILAANGVASAEFQKAIALADIAVSTAQSIAGIVKIASTSSPDPVTFGVQLTAGIATVLANIAQATNILTSANQPEAPQMQRFQKGGLVGGKLHSSGGTIAELEKGEFIMSRGAVSMFGPQIAAMNAMAGGVGATIEGGINQATSLANMQNSLADVIARLPAPVVSVRDIDSVKLGAERSKSRATVGVNSNPSRV